MMFFSKLIATGFGVGYFPKAPGTVGSLLAVFLYYIFFPNEPSVLIHAVFFIILALFFSLGVWTATRVETIYGHDPSCVVIDEIVGMGLTLFLIPKSWIWILIGLILFRLMDITKWLGADHMQQLKGGWGVMMDDVVAGFWSCIMLHTLIKIINFF
ncbi:phosphatidylglycerophosphatase A [bacterium]|nr:phosphatidylglycerophosphatase A [bacterium]